MNKMRVLLLAAGAAYGQPAIAVEVRKSDGGEAEVRAALARRDLQGAASAFNALVGARLPAKQADRPDPVLDRLLVEQLVAQGAQPPRPIVERLAADRSALDRVHNLLLLATIDESAGEETRARDHYKAAAAAAGATADQRLSAMLGLARLQLGTDPGAAAAMLRALDPAAVPAARRWEVNLQLARALSIQKPDDHAEQDAHLAKAWAAAPDGDLAHSPVARVAGDRAVLAARSGDRARLVALLAVDRSNRLGNAGQNMVASDLPVCGMDGIGRDDVAIVEAQRVAGPERPGIGLVWASRPGIGFAFLNAARRSGQLAVNDGAVAHFALRCRSAPAADYAVSARLMNDALGGWMTGKGAYPIVPTQDARNVTQLATILAERTARYGPDSILRLPILLMLMECLSPQVAGDAQTQARVTDLLAQITAVLDRNDAPEDMKLIWRINAVGMSMAAKTRTVAQAQDDFKSLLVAATTNPGVSRDFLYGMANGLAAQANASSEFKEAVLTATLKLFEREPAEDPRARALALQLYRLRAGNGDLDGARAALVGRTIPADLCALANPMARFVSSELRSDDYPNDMLQTMIVGHNPAEFDLDVTGHAVNGRLLISDPPYVFDDVTRRGIATVRYDPPRQSGKPQGCRGMVQNVRWQLPD